MDYINNLQKQVGPLVYAEILGIPGVLLMDPEDIQVCLNNIFKAKVTIIRNLQFKF